ncbi:MULTISPECIES: TerB family tellurite resistance protein [Aequorivita]|uniref:TerB family tellurite resistance protein n=1 Tax=Aequorivita iocasae TaxID=2803865 RepID=A0ABX7DNI0_9FLAO|nr:MULTISPECIES: TerB family tellurite resistance protein [Aequorivita]QQX75628.1 TerB family tellurite resistance protein [Aequorivita iocasae]UCA55084.1 TerB family tellurite resistance protein [Aequorivita sp. F7]
MERNPKSLLSDLINMVMADGKIKPSEIDFIQKLALRMDISDRELVDLFENPQPSRPVFSEVERITHFYKLILMMNIDNEAHESEIVALKNFGLKMGIRPVVADQILKKMNEYEENIVPAEELLKIFKIYYN